MSTSSLRCSGGRAHCTHCTMCLNHRGDGASRSPSRKVVHGRSPEAELGGRGTEWCMEGEGSAEFPSKCQSEAPLLCY